MPSRVIYDLHLRIYNSKFKLAFVCSRSFSKNVIFSSLMIGKVCLLCFSIVTFFIVINVPRRKLWPNPTRRRHCMQAHQTLICLIVAWTWDKPHTNAGFTCRVLILCALTSVATSTHSNLVERKWNASATRNHATKQRGSTRSGVSLTHSSTAAFNWANWPLTHLMLPKKTTRGWISCCSLANLFLASWASAFDLMSPAEKRL